METDYLIEAEIDNSNLPAITPEILQERRVAIYELLQSNKFSLPDRGNRRAPPGPYRLRIGMQNGRVVFDISTMDGSRVTEFHISLAPFRQITKDYFSIMGSYFDAVKALPSSKIETIDMARRGIHNEGARLLAERLEGKIVVDGDTARRLFTLVCALQVKR